MASLGYTVRPWEWRRDGSAGKEPADSEGPSSGRRKSPSSHASVGPRAGSGAQGSPVGVPLSSPGQVLVSEAGD